jgi:hypothetical protein
MQLDGLTKLIIDNQCYFDLDLISIHPSLTHVQNTFFRNKFKNEKEENIVYLSSKICYLNLENIGCRSNTTTGNFIEGYKNYTIDVQESKNLNRLRLSNVDVINLEKCKFLRHICLTSLPKEFSFDTFICSSQKKLSLEIYKSTVIISPILYKLFKISGDIFNDNIKENMKIKSKKKSKNKNNLVKFINGKSSSNWSLFCRLEKNLVITKTPINSYSSPSPLLYLFIPFTPITNLTTLVDTLLENAPFLERLTLKDAYKYMNVFTSPSFSSSSFSFSQKSTQDKYRISLLNYNHSHTKIRILSEKILDKVEYDTDQVYEMYVNIKEPLGTLVIERNIIVDLTNYVVENYNKTNKKPRNKIIPISMKYPSSLLRFNGNVTAQMLLNIKKK